MLHVQYMYIIILNKNKNILLITVILAKIVSWLKSIRIIPANQFWEPNTNSNYTNEIYREPIRLLETSS